MFLLKKNVFWPAEFLVLQDFHPEFYQPAEVNQFRRPFRGLYPGGITLPERKIT
jgi:hypothetical protein